MSNDDIVYLAGPIAACHWAEANDWRDYVARRLLVGGARSLSPMRTKGHLMRPEKIDKDFNAYSTAGPFYTSRGIMTRDANDVQQCSALFVNLLGLDEKPSYGTVMELGWAWWARKPVVVALGPDCALDLHPMVHEALGAFRYPSLDEAVDATLALLGLGRW